MIEGILFDENIKKWKRTCPKCEKDIFHENKYLCNISNKRKVICKSCAFTKITEIPPSITYDESKKQWYKTCPKCKNKIKQQSKAFAVLTVNSVCKNCIEYNYTDERNSIISKRAKERWQSKSFREKMTNHFKNIRYKNVNKKNIVSSYNPLVCSFLDEINKRNINLFFRHHSNNPSGEFCVLCYFADGYDEKNNIWFEYDEPHHENWSVKKKDLIRQKRIMGKLKCRFIRYSEKYKVFYEVFQNGIYQKIDEKQIVVI